MLLLFAFYSDGACHCVFVVFWRLRKLDINFRVCVSDVECQPVFVLDFKDCGFELFIRGNNFYFVAR